MNTVDQPLTGRCMGTSKLFVFLCRIIARGLWRWVVRHHKSAEKAWSFVLSWSHRSKLEKEHEILWNMFTKSNCSVTGNVFVAGSLFFKWNWDISGPISAVHIKTGKHRNIGKQPKYRKAHINTKKQWKINIYSIMWYVGNGIKGDPGKFMASLLNERKRNKCVCLCVEFNTAFNNFSVISL